MLFCSPKTVYNNVSAYRLPRLHIPVGRGRERRYVAVLPLATVLRLMELVRPRFRLGRALLHDLAASGRQRSARKP